jgi:hypothetical protein
VAGVADNLAKAEEMQSWGVILSLLKSFYILCPPIGPPAGSAKQPTEVKPKYAETVDAEDVVVTRVVIDVAVVEAIEVVGSVLGAVEVGTTEELLDEEPLELEVEIELEAELETELDDAIDTALRLLYIESREEPPQYSKVFPMQSKLQVFPVVERTLPVFGVFPQ